VEQCVIEGELITDIEVSHWDPESKLYKVPVDNR
jgi:hypothetical protein